MKIQIDLNVNLPDTFIAALGALINASPAVAPSHPAPAAASAKATKPAAEKPAANTPAEPTKEPEPVAVAHVTDEMIVSAADAAVVKVGSNPAVIKNAIGAYFQKEDGSPGTLKTVRADQRGQLHTFLVAVGQSGDVNAAAAAASLGR